MMEKIMQHAERAYLPHYASEAYGEIKAMANLMDDSIRRGQDVSEIPYVAASHHAVADLIKNAVHVVLPENGEIYRSTENTIPSEDECKSMANLPAPITCFEYSYTLNVGVDLNKQVCALPDIGIDHAPKRLTLVTDFKQLGLASNRVSVISVYYCVDANSRQWSFSPWQLFYEYPLKFISRGGNGVSIGCGFIKMFTAEELIDPLEKMQAVTEYEKDLNIVAQACHSLLAGAELLPVVEKSPTKLRKIGKKKLPKFSYHLLKIPSNRGVDKDFKGGHHSSPRRHLRRAHLRKLQTGTYTFVRQCVVGDADKGFVSKNYKVERK